MAALEATRGQHPRWCFTFSGKRIQQSSTAWDKAKQRAGIEDFRFHDLRHTWASWHVQSGTSLPELMELGGWKSYEMVLRYAHLAPEKLSFVAGRIERQASRPIEEAPLVQKRSKKRYVFATVGTLSARKFLIELVRPERFELPASWFVARRSIQLSYGRKTTNRNPSRQSHKAMAGCRPVHRPMGSVAEREGFEPSKGF